MKRPPIKRKATGQADADEILPEYDFSRASPNKYASRYAAGSAREFGILKYQIRSRYTMNENSLSKEFWERRGPHRRQPPPHMEVA